MAIIVGFQGVGKTTLAKQLNNFIDLESSNFFINGVRPDGWEQMYVKIAQELSKQGFIVFTSSHTTVRELLKETDEALYILLPHLDLEVEWNKKLEKRYIETQLDKDYRAWQNSEAMYSEMINELLNESTRFNKIVLNRAYGYDLFEIIAEVIGSKGVN